MIELKVAKNHYKYLIAAFLILALAAIIKVTTSVVYAADKAGPVSERIVTIHDAGTEKGIATNASTLREVLKQADIRIDPKDMTEPGLDEPLVASSYEANIYRARPVAIKDGATTTRIITAYRTGKQIAKQANIELLDADKAELSPAKDIITDGAAEVLTIDRATHVAFVFYGKTLQTSTRATTVGGMLNEKDIKMAESDTITPGLDAKINAGMTVQLWRNGKQVITVDEDVAFKTRKINDADRERTYREVKTKGENGKRTVTYEIEMRDGVEVARKEISSVVTKEAVEQVEIVGAKNNYSASLNEWLLALRTCETGGRYDRNSGNGYYGAYQFLPSTWNSIARKTGRGDLVGVMPHMAAPADQDAMVIANANMTAGLSTQHPGCYAKLGLSNKPPAQ